MTFRGERLSGWCSSSLENKLSRRCSDKSTLSHRFVRTLHRRFWERLSFRLYNRLYLVRAGGERLEDDLRRETFGRKLQDDLQR